MMQALCDANLLLASAYKQHGHHTAAIAWLDARNEHEVVVCRITQMSLLRLLTNSTVMGADTCTHDRAWQVWDALLSDARFLMMAEPKTLEPHLRIYSQARLPSPKLWQDAYLAAFCRSAGIRVATFDRGFQRFPDLQLDLLA
jgi:toxin-antitoxin system PIN domain toxin